MNRLLTDKEIVKEASKDSTYCQLSVDIGMWAAKEEHKRTLKAVGEWLAGIIHNRNAVSSVLEIAGNIDRLKRGEMPEDEKVENA